MKTIPMFDGGKPPVLLKLFTSYPPAVLQLWTCWGRGLHLVSVFPLLCELSAQSSQAVCT